MFRLKPMSGLSEDRTSIEDNKPSEYPSTGMSYTNFDKANEKKS